MTLFKKNFLVLGSAAFVFSLLLVVTVLLINSTKLLIIFLCIYLIAVFFAVYKYVQSFSYSFSRLAEVVQNSVSFLPDSNAKQSIPMEFKSLERAMRTITQEVNRRLGQAESESSRLEAILNGMSEAVFAVDKELKLHLVNPKARELFGLEDCDIKTASPGNKMTLLEATRCTELVETARNAISSGASLERDLALHTGKEQFFQVYASPMGNNAGVVLVLQEITKLVKLERVRKDFVANVSHELRTPIQLIKGFSETLLDSVSDKQNHHFIEIIHKNANTMENLTNDLLILADLENGSIVREKEEVNAALLVDEAVSSLELRAKQKQIEVIVTCRENINVKMYGSLMIQALINLIDNGIKYSPSKSKLWISASLENDELRFEVRDKGMGIPAKHLEKIFERFYRVDPARNKNEQTAFVGGTGLGLSIVRHIALLHNGTAEVESHAGEGSIFKIIIPVNR